LYILLLNELKVAWFHCSVDVKSVELTKTNATINLTLIHQVGHPIHRKYSNVCLCRGQID